MVIIHLLYGLSMHGSLVVVNTAMGRMGKGRTRLICDPAYIVGRITLVRLD